LGLKIAQSDHKVQRYRFKVVGGSKIVTFRGGKDGFIQRTTGRASKSLEWILQKWEDIVPVGNDLQTTTSSMLLRDAKNALEDYHSIAGRQGVEALLELFGSVGKEQQGLFQPGRGGGIDRS